MRSALKLHFRIPLGIALTFAISVLMFENCSDKKFTPSSSSSASALSTGPASVLPTPAPNPAPSPSPVNTGPAYCSNFTNSNLGGTQSGNSNLIATSILGQSASLSSLAQIQNGIQASLTYLLPSDPNYANNDITTLSLAPGQPDVVQAPGNVFLSQLAVATQPGRVGFSNGPNGPLTDSNGNTLIQNFSLRMSGFLLLPSSLPAGTYQIAFIVDDGVTMSVGQGDGSTSEIVNFDGGHSSSFTCAGSTVNFQQQQLVPYQINYLQGNQNCLAIMAFWRKVDLSNPNSLTDPLCPSKVGGDNYFFNSNTQAPTSNTTALLSRGWSLIPPAAWVLPLNSGPNPCSN